MPSSLGQSNPALNDEGTTTTNSTTYNDQETTENSNKPKGLNSNDEDNEDNANDNDEDEEQNNQPPAHDLTGHSLVAAAWNCLHNDTLSPDSEYDEGLAFPDSVTILSMGGENPVLVERNKNNDDEDGDADSLEVPSTDQLPYLNVYKTPVKFTSVQRKVFIPDVEIEVQIVHHERSSTTHLLNPNLYTIELKHGPYVWQIKKRYKHFYALHQQLRVYRATLNIPFPTRTHKERRASFRNNYSSAAEAREEQRRRNKEGGGEQDIKVILFKCQMKIDI